MTPQDKRTKEECLNCWHSFKYDPKVDPCECPCHQKQVNDVSAVGGVVTPVKKLEFESEWEKAKKNLLLNFEKFPLIIDDLLDVCILFIHRLLAAERAPNKCCDAIGRKFGYHALDCPTQTLHG